jgi:hypothetical protein
MQKLCISPSTRVRESLGILLYAQVILVVKKKLPSAIWGVGNIPRQIAVLIGPTYTSSKPTCMGLKASLELQNDNFWI